MSCPRCGAESLRDEKFCSNCGAPLAIAESAQSAVAAASEPGTAPGSTAKAVPEPSPAPPQPSTTPQASTTLMSPIPDGGLTIEEVAAWLEREGYSAKFVTGESGKRHIESSTQGSPLNVFFSDCKDERWACLELAAGFATHGKFDISRINAWNYNNRWCRAYYDDVNDPWLKMNIDLSPGGTYEALNDLFGTWNRTLGRFIEEYSLR